MRASSTILGPGAIAGAVLIALTAWRLVAFELGPLTLMFDEAQYWTWAKDPAFGYFSKPPMVAWLIAFTTSLCGDGEACVRASSPLLHLATAFAVWLLARRMFGPRVAAVAAVVYATMPGVSFLSGFISTDMPLLLFWALAVFALHRAVSHDRTRDWVAFGIAFGLGMLSKYTMVLLAPCAALFLVLSPAHRGHWRNPRLALGLVVALCVLAPNIVWNAEHGFVSVRHLGDNASLGGPLVHPDELGAFFAAQFAVFGPILFAVYLWIAINGRRLAAGDSRILYLLCLSLPVLLVMLVQSLLSRAHANWAFVTYVPASVLVAWYLCDRHRIVLAASFALHVTAMPVIHHYDAITGGGIAGLDPYRRMRGWDELGRGMSELLAANPRAVLLADSRRLMAQMMYYVRPHPFDAVKWNPTRSVRDHYDLTTDIATAAERPMLLVTRRADADHVAPRFARSERLGVLEATPYEGFTLRYPVYRLSGFRGYPESP